MRSWTTALGISAVLLAASPAMADRVDYLNFEAFGSTWSNVEKRLKVGDDTLL